MNLKLLKIYSLIGFISLFLLTACDKNESEKKIDKQPSINLSNEQLLFEIKQRFDILKEDNHYIACVVFNQISGFPFEIESNYMTASMLNGLSKLIGAQFLTETISLVPDKYNEDRNVTKYEYNLTEKSKPYYQVWPRIKQSGFCFDHITITSIDNIKSMGNQIYLEYSYTIDNIPTEIETLLQWNTDTPNKPQISRAIFLLDENGQIYSKEGISLKISKF